MWHKARKFIMRVILPLPFLVPAIFFEYLLYRNVLYPQISAKERTHLFLPFNALVTVFKLSTSISSQGKQVARSPAQVRLSQMISTSSLSGSVLIENFHNECVLAFTQLGGSHCYNMGQCLAFVYRVLYKGVKDCLSSRPSWTISVSPFRLCFSGLSSTVYCICADYFAIQMCICMINVIITQSALVLSNSY